MTPIPGKPFFGAYDYEKYGNIIIDNFIVEFEDGWRTWVCDKCKDFGLGSVYPDLDDRNQLLLFDIPYEQTDDYKYTYFAAQRHYEWYHKGEYETLQEQQAREQAEIRAEIKAQRAKYAATVEVKEPEWHDTAVPQTKWVRFKAFFGFESYHGKHRREDFDDMPAVREVQRQWSTWHTSVVRDFEGFDLGTWQGQQRLVSKINLNVGYHPYKRKRHRK